MTPVRIDPRTFTVRELAELKKNRSLLLPDLQRGFVWSNDRIKALFDSLNKGYPIGALLLWKPGGKSSEEGPLATRAWDLLPLDPNTKKGVPEQVATYTPSSIYVLDGQQRLTSIFRAIFRSCVKGKDKPDPDLRVALSSKPEWVDNPFCLYSRQLQSKLRDGLIVPLHVLFARFRNEEENTAVREALKNWLKPDDEDFFKALDRANALRDALLNAKVLAYEIDADDENDEDVIEIFIRINQQGVRLKPGDLASARLTGKMSNFRNQAAKALQDEEFKGFSSVGTSSDEGVTSGAAIDTDAIIRTSLFLGTDFIKYRDAEKKKAPDEIYSKVQDNWARAVLGLQSVVRSLRSAGVGSAAWLSSRFLLFAPAIAEATRQQAPPNFWLGWILAASLWQHYSKAGETRAQSDARLARQGKFEELVNSIKGTAKRHESLAPEPDDLTEGAVPSGGVLLALLMDLVHHDGRSFTSGQRIIQCDDLEVHHIFPQSQFDSKTSQDSRSSPDRIGNLTLLSKADNGALSDKLPAEYLGLVKSDSLKNHRIPTDSRLWTPDRYDDFCTAREAMLAELIAERLRACKIA